jgi:hypothetical protein
MGSDARVVMATLADSIAAGVDSLIVFNPLNWKRDGEVPIDLDKGIGSASQQAAHTNSVCLRAFDTTT